MRDTLSLDARGHYQLRLPWRDLTQTLPGSRLMAECRLASLRRPDLLGLVAQVLLPRRVLLQGQLGENVGWDKQCRTMAYLTIITSTAQTFACTSLLQARTIR